MACTRCKDGFIPKGPGQRRVKVCPCRKPQPEVRDGKQAATGEKP